MNNYYQALGISESATPEVVKIAYEGKLKALARAKVADGERKAEESLLRQAYGTLSNPDRRASYDAKLDGAADREASSSRRMAIGAVAAVVVALVGGVAWYASARSAKLERIRIDEARIARESEDLKRRAEADLAEKERRDRDAAYAQQTAEQREEEQRRGFEHDRSVYRKESDRSQREVEREAERARSDEKRAAAERERAEARGGGRCPAPAKVPA